MSIWQRGVNTNVRFQYAAIIATVVLASQISLHDLSLEKIAISAYENLAAVASMSASIAPNPENTLLAQLREKDKELTAREAALLAQEQHLDAKYQEEIVANKRLTLATLSGVTLCLLLLIVANFYFDIKREEEREHEIVKDITSEHHGGLTTKL